MIDAWEEAEATNKPIMGVCNPYLIDACYYDDVNNPKKFKYVNIQYTTGLMAEYFVIQPFNNFKYCNDILYYWNGIYWEPSDKKYSKLVDVIDGELFIKIKKLAYNAIIYFKKQALKETDETPNKIPDNNCIELSDGYILSSGETALEIESGLKYYNNLRNSVQRKQLIDNIIIKVTNNNIKFDTNPYLFAFNNKIYDLKNDTFVTPNQNRKENYN